MLGDKSWSRSGVLNLFSSAYVPAECTYTVTLTSRMASNGGIKDGTIGWLEWENTDSAAAAAEAAMGDGFKPIIGSSPAMSIVFRERFLIHSIFGSDRARDMALKEPFKSLQLLPFVTIAHRIIDQSEMDLDLGFYPPETGGAYCLGGLIGETGLPFHVEGPFLQNPGVRHLLLPISPERYRSNEEKSDNEKVHESSCLLFYIYNTVFSCFSNLLDLRTVAELMRYHAVMSCHYTCTQLF